MPLLRFSQPAAATASWLLLSACGAGTTEPHAQATAPPAPGNAATAPLDSVGLHAQLTDVGDSMAGDATYGVHLPQVTLSDAATARRLNAALVQELAAVADSLPPAVSGAQAVRLARPHLAERPSSSTSGSFSYQVLYNAQGLLSLEFVVAQPGESIEDYHHATFDLRTGRPLALAALLTNPPGLARYWQRQRRARLTAQVQEIADALPDDPSMRTQLQQTLGWNAHTRTVSAVPLAQVDFALTRQGLVLYEDFTHLFPHPHYGLSPQAEYAYSWAELQRWRGTQGPWQAPVPR